jgi:hypothetical protein
MGPKSISHVKKVMKRMNYHRYSWASYQPCKESIQEDELSEIFMGFI